MLLATSVRLSPELYREIEDIAGRRNTTVSAFIREILEEYTGQKRGGLSDIHDHLQFDISLTIKALYLLRFIADSIDKDAAEDVLADAEDFIRKSGLVLSSNQVEAHEEDGDG